MNPIVVNSLLPVIALILLGPMVLVHPVPLPIIAGLVFAQTGLSIPP